MKFEYTEPQDELEKMFGGFYCINAYGKIGVGDCDRFLHFLENASPPPRCPVYINSDGGSVADAIRMGMLIRGAWFSTNVGSYILSKKEQGDAITPRTMLPGNCMSAATLMYLGGRLRYLDKEAKFGVHQFSYSKPSVSDASKSQLLSAEIARYLSVMEIDARFLELSAATPSSDIKLLDHQELRDLGVVTDGETKPIWTTESRNNMLYVRGERDGIYGHHKVMLSYSKSAGFLFWAVIEAQGREDELTSFGLVEIVINGEDYRVDISERCAREVFGIYVNIISQITPDEAKLIAYSDSFGVHVRFSQDAELHLGIAAVSTESGADQLITLFETVS